MMTLTDNRRPRQHLRLGALAGLALFLSTCGSLERSNPADPGAADRVDRTSSNALSLVIPLPKPLISVVDSLVAVLEGPGMTPIVKQLEHSPLGPATLTMGAVSPGTGRTLTIFGYDHEGQLIMEGERRNIDIAVGDTTRITINLRLIEGVNEPDAGGDDGSTDDGSVDDGSTPEEGGETEGEGT